MIDRTSKLLAIACVLLICVSCSIKITTGGSDEEEDGNRPCHKEPCEKKGPCARECQRSGMDPFAENAGCFLDVDLNELEKQAQEAYNTEKYEEAAALYLKLLSHNITDGGNIYNLACCYGLLGKAELAAKHLERAYKMGFTDVGWMKNDPDFEKVKESEQFKAAIATIEAQVKDKEEGKGETIYIDASAQFRCRLKFPEGYDASKTYPLIVGLHGYGSDPEAFTVLWERFENPNFIYAVPQAQYPRLRGNEQGYSWSAPLPEGDPAGERSKLEAEEYVAKLVKHLKSEYKVGDTYLLGFSQGCGMTYTTGIKNHDLFKGLICFGGWFSEDWLVKKAGIDLNEMNDLRVFIAHGSKDQLVKIEEGLKAREILEKHGYDVTFYEFDGPHTVAKEALLEAQKWMAKKETRSK